MRVLTAFLAALSIAACQGPGDRATWLGRVEEIGNPGAPGGRYPRLAAGPDGTIVMSWLQPVGEGHELRYARWLGSSWSAPATVAAGADWFVNWADFPSVVPGPQGRLTAHWLQQTPGSVYSYEVRMAVSDDGGRNWSGSFSSHDDGTPTEHGFVSLLPRHADVLAVWLDGRHTSAGHDHDATAGGAMSLRSTVLTGAGRVPAEDREVDGRVCDCCQTDAAMTRDGPVVVYRDRTENEVRDIALVRLEGDGWSEPVRVHEDRWTIDACPVNGPAVAARGDTVVVAWFTAPDVPRVRLAFSDDGGRTFGLPLEVASGRVTGRVDVVLLEDGRAVVSWLADGAEGTAIHARPYLPTGPAGAEVLIGQSSATRASGFPRLLAVREGLLFAWTQPGDSPRVVTAFAPLL